MEDRVNGVLPTRYYIISPDRRVLEIIQPETLRDDLPRLLALIKKHAQAQGVVASAPPKATDLTALAQKDVLWYSCTSRFLPFDGQPAPVGRNYRYPSYPTGACPVPPLVTSLYLRGLAPVTVREYLTAAQCKALLPPPTARTPGQEYTVPQDAAASLAFQFRPPTHFNTPAPSDLSDLECHAKVLACKDGVMELALWGAMDAYDPWFPTPLQDGPKEFVAHHARCSFAGQVRVAVPEDKITRLAVATDWGLFCGEDGTLLPYVSFLDTGTQACSLRDVAPPSKPRSDTGIDVPDPRPPSPTPGGSLTKIPPRPVTTFKNPAGGETLIKAAAPGTLPEELNNPSQGPQPAPPRSAPPSPALPQGQGPAQNSPPSPFSGEVRP